MNLQKKFNLQKKSIYKKARFFKIFDLDIDFGLTSKNVSFESRHLLSIFATRVYWRNVLLTLLLSSWNAGKGSFFIRVWVFGGYLNFITNRIFFSTHVHSCFTAMRLQEGVLIESEDTHLLDFFITLPKFWRNLIQL